MRPRISEDTAERVNRTADELIDRVDAEALSWDDRLKVILDELDEQQRRERDRAGTAHQGGTDATADGLDLPGEVLQRGSGNQFNRR